MQPGEEGTRAKLELLQVDAKAFELASRLEIKLDVAFEIYLVASELAKSLPDDDKCKSYVTRLRDQSVAFMKTVLNVSSDAEMVELAEKRRKMREYAPDFLPRGEEVVGVDDASSAVKYQWKRLAKLALALKKRKIMRVDDKSRLLDKQMTTIYLTPEQRAKHRVVLKNGEFRRPVYGKGLDDEQFEVCDTTSMKSHEKPGYAAYVINAQGEMAIFNHHGMADRYAHSSMFAGVSVLAAGEVKIVKGKLIEITTHSGHYQPSIENVYQTLKHLQRQGVDINNVQIRLFAHTDKVPCVEKQMEHRPRFYAKGSDIVAWGDNLQKQAEAQRKPSGLEVTRKGLKAEKIKQFEQSGLSEVCSLMKNLRVEVDESIACLQQAQKDLGSAGGVIDRLKSIWHSWVGKGSHKEMKVEKINAAINVVEDIKKLKEKMDKDLSQLELAARGELKVEVMRKLFKESGASERLEELQKSYISIKDRFEGAASEIESKYKRKGVMSEERRKIGEKFDQAEKSIGKAKKNIAAVQAFQEDFPSEEAPSPLKISKLG